MFATGDAGPVRGAIPASSGTPPAFLNSLGPHGTPSPAEGKNTTPLPQLCPPSPGMKSLTHNDSLKELASGPLETPARPRPEVTCAVRATPPHPNSGPTGRPGLSFPQCLFRERILVGGVPKQELALQTGSGPPLRLHRRGPNLTHKARPLTSNPNHLGPEAVGRGPRRPPLPPASRPPSRAKLSAAAGPDRSRPSKARYLSSRESRRLSLAPPTLLRLPIGCE